MANIKRFEELECWRSARKLTKEVFLISDKGKLSKDFEIKNQIRSASLSIMNNIAEGFGRFSEKEFIRFLNVAQSSGLEVKSMLYLLEDLNYLNQDDLGNLMQEVNKTISLTLGLLRYLNNK